MSKTYLDQVEKAKNLVNGTRKNLAKVADRGITASQLDELERLAKEAEELNYAVDAIRAEVSARLKAANDKLVVLKEKKLPMKNTIKSAFLQSQWEAFGIPDKR